MFHFPETACCNRYRYIILALGVCCLASICSNYNIINFTFICMTDDATEIIKIGNMTRQRYDYTPTEKSYIIWAVAIGTIIGTFPINYAYVRFGARMPFFIAGVTSAIATSLIPLAAHFGLVYLVLLRLLQGLAYAADFAAIGILCVRWAPLSQIALFIGFLTSFSPIANAITNPISGFFCTSSLGWRWAFYSHSLFCLIIFILWLVFYSDDPQTHRSVSCKELDYIQKNKTKEHIERDSFVPYLKICTNKTILVVWLNAFTELVSYIVIITYAPIYINKVLGYSITSTSFLASIGSVIHVPIKLITAFLSDNVTCFSEVRKMIFFNTAAVGVCGLACGLIGVMPESWMSVFMITFSAAICAFNCGGFYKCGTLTSRQYAHFVLATIQFSKCVALFIGPGLVALLTSSDSDAAGWRNIFLVNCFFMLISNFLFYLVVSDEPAPFTHITRHNKEPLGSQQKAPQIQDKNVSAMLASSSL